MAHLSDVTVQEAGEGDARRVRIRREVIHDGEVIQTWGATVADVTPPEDFERVVAGAVRAAESWPALVVDLAPSNRERVLYAGVADPAKRRLIDEALAAAA